MDFKKIVHSNIGAAVLNLLLAYAVFMATRVAFFLVNWDTYAPYMSWQLAGSMLKGALVFDTSALLYINSLYLVLMLLPLHLKEFPGFQQGLRWLYVVTNSIGAASNLIDSVYFQYTGRRSTVTVFSEFANENNVASILLHETVVHWYLAVLMAVLALVLWRCFTTARIDAYRYGWQYYVSQTAALLVCAPLAIIGIRGSATAGTKPITISNANQYVNRPVESSLVLNTPFSMIRSIGKKPFVTPNYMPRDEMERTYTPVHQPAAPDSLMRPGRNVVVLIIESMGKEYIGCYNRDVDGGRYKGYMPFVDSLAGKSLTFKYSYANGRKSMDAMPSVLSGLPMMVEPLFLTPASLNDIQGLASMLAPMGYSSAFFHGGHNISMGFSAFAHDIGYQRYYGLNEYCASKNPAYHGMKDFDGKWAIYDEPFMQFMLDNLGQLKQPFLATLFSASSHEPYNVPSQYKDVFKDEPGGLPIYKAIRYTDHSLRRFFERASRQPWFKNTVFVLVADHTNLHKLPAYMTDLGLYSIPIIFYTPDGTLRPEMNTTKIAQQTDITPTLLHLVGYRKPYLAFGCDLLATPAAQTWAFNYNSGVYQYEKGDWMLQFDGASAKAMYRFKTDPLLKRNLAADAATPKAAMEKELKAIIQQYMSRMNENRLLPNR